MKKNRHFKAIHSIAIIAILAIIGFSFTACDEDSTNENGNNNGNNNGNTALHEGTWNKGSYQLVINGTSFTIIKDSQHHTRGAITFTGNNTTGSFVCYFYEYWSNGIWIVSPVSNNGIYQKSGNTLTLTGLDTQDFNGGWSKSSVYDPSLGANNIGRIGPGGGIIFYFSEEGFKLYMSADDTVGVEAQYLEASSTIQGTLLRWSTATDSPFATISNVANATAIGTGKRNTSLILAGDSTAPAALSTHGTIGTKADWFLPSSDELFEMYKQRSLLNLTTGILWSSSQSDNDNALLRDFSNILWGSSSKKSALTVRAIRAF